MRLEIPAPNRTRALLAMALLLISGTLHANHPEPPEQWKDVYTFGVVPQYEQRKLFSIWRPILNRLETLTGLKFQLTGTTRISSFEEDFANGNYDFTYMNSYQVARCEYYIPLVRDHLRTLQGVIVVHKDSGITSIADLQHREMVFPSANAFGASLLIRQELKELHGIQVEPRYAQTHSSAYLHVAKGLSLSGGGVQSTFRNQKPQVRDSLRILYRTRAMPSHPISAHQRVPAEVREKVRTALLQIAGSDEGRQLLSRVPIDSLISSGRQDLQSLAGMNLEAYLEE